MAVVVKTAYHTANVDLTVPLPVGKKIYGITGVYGTSVRIIQNGVTARILDNSGSTREVWFPCPIEFAESSSFVFNGNVGATVAIFHEE